MSQSALLVGLLLAAFVLYVAAKGRLATYAGVLFDPAPQSGNSAPSSGSSSSSGSKSGINLDTVITLGETLLNA